MRPAPPGDERVGIARPTFRFQVRRRDFPQPRLHVHHGAVLVEHADFDGALQFGDLGHSLPPLLSPYGAATRHAKPINIK